MLHLHVTAILSAIDGRATSKPAQIGIRRLTIAPDVVFVRGNLTSDEGLRAVLPRAARVVRLSERPYAPESAAWDALATAGVLAKYAPLSAPSFALPASAGEVCVLGDAHIASHMNLCWRLRLWSGGQLRVRFGVPSAATLGVVLVGHADSASEAAFEGPVLDLRLPADRRRNSDARIDWMGTFDHPVSPLADWIEGLLKRPSANCDRRESERPSAYAEEAFAQTYLEASYAHALRDHDQLDELVWSAVGALVGKRVLDLGCGAGRWSARLVDAGAVVVGVEPAHAMANAAERRRLANFTLLRTRAEDYEPTGRFDGVLASMSLDHVANVGGALARIVPSLAPGGWFIVTTEHPLRTAPKDGRRWVEDDSPRSARVRDYGSEGWRRLLWFGRPEPVWVYRRTLSQWVALLREAGLVLVDVAEPVAPDPRDAGNPRFWMLVARRG